MTWPFDPNPETSFTLPNTLELVVALVVAIRVAWIVYRSPALVADISRRYLASLRHVRLYILAAAVLPVAVRLAILPWCPVPEPVVHDEFGHLLVADTLAHGRLTNPQHALWRHLETVYVLQQPTYASSYPIGQGLILAVGEVLFGHPWVGVLLAVALMSAATSWMLFGCLPPAWAAAGGLLFAVQYGLIATWVDSYWGGAFCAFGGSLLFGALCRLQRNNPSMTMAALIGIGWTIVWLIRPYESLLPLLGIWGLIAAYVVRARPGEEGLRAARKKWLAPILILLAVQASAGVITAVHNRAVTGSFTTLPYILSQRIYGVPARFLWQKGLEDPQLKVRELEEVYNWQKEKAKEGADDRFAHVLYSMSWSYLADSWYLLPLGLCVFLRKDPLVAVGASLAAGTLATCVLYPFFFPHYIAAYACVLAFLILRGLMLLSRWSYRKRIIGPVVVAFLLAGGVTARLEALVVHAHATTGNIPTFRVALSRELAKRGGQHVVFVRYGPKHRFHNEWVYNDADIDSSPVVWCRWMGEVEDAEVAEYYPGRRMWLVDMGQVAATVAPYKPRRVSDSPGDSSASLKKVDP